MVCRDIVIVASEACDAVGKLVPLAKMNHLNTLLNGSNTWMIHACQNAKAARARPLPSLSDNGGLLGA